jgi:hypothetical protein
LSKANGILCLLEERRPKKFAMCPEVHELMSPQLLQAGYRELLRPVAPEPKRTLAFGRKILPCLSPTTIPKHHTSLGNKFK